MIAPAISITSEQDLSGLSEMAPSSEDERVRDLTGRLAAGEEAAWREFHHLYFDRLLGYLRARSGGNEHAAREALQAALTRIVSKAQKFESAAQWWSWLTTVARNCVLDDSRRRARYRNFLERYGLFSKCRHPFEDEDSRPEMLAECVEELSPRDRALLRAKYTERLSTSAMAVHFGCTEKAIECALARLRARLRKQVEERRKHES